MSKLDINSILENLQLGADPEVFVFDGENPISAVGLVPGTKAEPFKVDNGAVQLDGMAAEFNIDPAKNPEQFNANIQSVLSTLKGIIGDYRLGAVPTAHFGAELIAKQPASARELGCEPDYNAYTGKENPRPNADTPFRTGAGHVHIGWGEGFDPFSTKHFNDCRMLAMQLDYHLGVAAMSYDNDVERQSLYGDFGCFRPKPYGMEYRVLSNAWLKDEKLIDWVFKSTKNAFAKLLMGNTSLIKASHSAKSLSDIFKGNRHGVLNWLETRGIILPPTVGENFYVR